MGVVGMETWKVFVASIMQSFEATLSLKYMSKNSSNMLVKCKINMSWTAHYRFVLLLTVI